MFDLNKLAFEPNLSSPIPRHHNLYFNIPRWFLVIHHDSDPAESHMYKTSLAVLHLRIDCIVFS